MPQLIGIVFIYWYDCTRMSHVIVSLLIEGGHLQDVVQMCQG